MFEIETHEYSKANLERLAFYYDQGGKAVIRNEKY